MKIGEILSALASAWNGKAHADCACHPQLNYRPRRLDGQSHADDALEQGAGNKARPAGRFQAPAA
ncbi:MAG: hypothetical protein KF810_10640 [Rhizobiaceae bacterium]|nr:hypothetical protein [Rhizobiaceae bacterium]